jgi:hypothetical protein
MFSPKLFRHYFKPATISPFCRSKLLVTSVKGAPKDLKGWNNKQILSQRHRKIEENTKKTSSMKEIDQITQTPLFANTLVHLSMSHRRKKETKPSQQEMYSNIDTPQATAAQTVQKK